MALLPIFESPGQNSRVCRGWECTQDWKVLKMALWACTASLEQRHLHSVLLAIGHLPPQYKKKKESAWVNIVSCWKSSLLQADNGYLTVQSQTNGSSKFPLISAGPPGVLIRTFLVNNQTGNCSLTAGNFHQTAVNLCTRVSSFSLTRRVIPIRQQLILIIQSVS